MKYQLFRKLRCLFAALANYRLAFGMAAGVLFFIVVFCKQLTALCQKSAPSENRLGNQAEDHSAAETPKSQAANFKSLGLEQVKPKACNSPARRVDLVVEIVALYVTQQRNLTWLSR